ncbi:hypothetical protein JCGZ_01928 [Jatropha curcas]|uniref:Uncharacterized protein n=1 Tax=Jatropha curcas TaxID=180498 RepID=A0A067JT79_JATCU|nr:hypothetical protein JCGZ_01928 [Jatropha curcas]
MRTCINITCKHANDMKPEPSLVPLAGGGANLSEDAESLRGGVCDIPGLGHYTLGESHIGYAQGGSDVHKGWQP